MFQYPYGDSQQLNLDWLMEQWQETKASIDGSLQGEIDRVEAAITDLLTARDQAVAAQTAAETAATSASGYAGTASAAASTATAQATAAAASAALAGTHASNAQTSETNAGLQATAAGNSASAAAVSATNARNSELAAAASSSAAAGNALYAEGMAKGTQNGTPVTSGSPYYEDNSAYWAGEAQVHASNAVAAAYYSEAMAKGTVNGTPVASGEPGYDDNAEYYKDQAAAQAAAAAASAASADGAAAQAMIAQVESSSTASAAHAAGTYFRLNGVLYMATQDIAVGATITPGTNCSVAVLGNDVSELKTAFTDYFAIELEVNPELTVGTYVNASNGSLVTNQSNFSMTAPIPVKKGQTINLYAKGYNAVIGMIATCNEDNTTRQVVVSSSDSNYHDYKYTVAEDGYVVCSFVSYNATHSISLTIDYYDKSVKVDDLNVYEQGTIDVPISKQENGYFVDNSGGVQSSANFFISQSIKLYKGQKITWSARGYNQNVSMISSYDSVENEYTPLVISIDSTSRNYEYTARDNVEVIRCCALWYSSGSNVPYSATVTTTSITVGAVCEAIAGIEEDPLSAIQYPQIFTKIICMGDSITLGFKGSGTDLATHNYPFYLAKLADVETTIQAQSSINAKNFWTTYADDYDYTPYDCAIIYLGTNDGLTDSVDTDCFEDYTQNADTQTGAYGKIIGRIKATAPNCKIFVVAGVNDYVRRATTMNPAVRALADFYEVGLIDIENCIMSDGGGGTTEQRLLYRPIDGIHYNTLGYMTMANMMYDSMNDFMSKHRDMYKIS